MMRIRFLLRSLLVLAVAIGGWVLRPVAADRPDTVDWEHAKALITNPQHRFSMNWRRMASC